MSHLFSLRLLLKYPGIVKWHIKHESRIIADNTAIVLSRVSQMKWVIKVHIIWEGHNILRNLHLTFILLKYPKKCFEDLTTFFMSTWWGDSKSVKEIEFSRWLFEGRLWQGKNVLPDGLNWLCYFAGNSKSHRENSIFFIFLESPHQVDMKNVVKC